jgi:hypothetical protein
LANFLIVRILWNDLGNAKWEDNIKMDLRETEWEGVDWIYLAQDKGQWEILVFTVMNLRVP